MLFNSFQYGLFLIIVYLIYWLVLNRNFKIQNLFVLGASYFFYACWDWRFLSLIIISSAVDFFVGRNIFSTKNHRKRIFLLIFSIAVNISILGYFKYANFFIESFAQLLETAGFSTSNRSLYIILPVGISFYTFQTLSYTIDIYKKKIKPTDDIIAFFSFVSFFPQLVAGPIERASNLLPQFLEKRKFNYHRASDGLKQILWGLFKKVVIADTLAGFVDHIFNNWETLPGNILFIGVIYFAFQIYCDFSGYSDIAIGTARLLSFDLMRNFAYPYS